MGCSRISRGVTHSFSPQKGSLKLCCDTVTFKEMCNSEGFEFFALSPNYIAVSNQTKGFAGLAASIFNQNAEYKGEGNYHEVSKIYVIFVDSLDSSVLENEETLQSLPGLKELYRNSLFFKNFTSSGFWTYPCLHSLNTGISPKYTSSFLKLDPLVYPNIQNNLRQYLAILV